jgi:hypothetical protein
VATDTNTGGFRVGHFTIAGATYTVYQDGVVTAPATCSSVTLSQTSFYSGAIESGWPVAVTAPDGSCTWNVTSDSPWLVVTSTPAAPAGSGSIWVATDTNTGGFRVGHFTIAGATYTVSQDGATGLNSTQGSQSPHNPLKP